MIRDPHMLHSVPSLLPHSKATLKPTPGQQSLFSGHDHQDQFIPSGPPKNSLRNKPQPHFGGVIEVTDAPAYKGSIHDINRYLDDQILTIDVEDKETGEITFQYLLLTGNHRKKLHKFKESIDLEQLATKRYQNKLDLRNVRTKQLQMATRLHSTGRSSEPTQINMQELNKTLQSRRKEFRKNMKYTQQAFEQFSTYCAKNAIRLSDPEIDKLTFLLNELTI